MPHEPTGSRSMECRSVSTLTEGWGNSKTLHCAAPSSHPPNSRRKGFQFPDWTDDTLKIRLAEDPEALLLLLRDAYLYKRGKRHLLDYRDEEPYPDAKASDIGRFLSQFAETTYEGIRNVLSEHPPIMTSCHAKEILLTVAHHSYPAHRGFFDHRGKRYARSEIHPLLNQPSANRPAQGRCPRPNDGYLRVLHRLHPHGNRPCQTRQ